jgi:hypothetical protein
MSATISVFSIEFPSFEKASHRTPIRRALSAFAFPNAAIFRRSLVRPSDFSSHGARHSWGNFILDSSLDRHKRFGLPFEPYACFNHLWGELCG